MLHLAAAGIYHYYHYYYYHYYHYLCMQAVTGIHRTGVYNHVMSTSHRAVRHPLVLVLQNAQHSMPLFPVSQHGEAAPSYQVNERHTKRRQTCDDGTVIIGHIQVCSARSLACRLC